MLPIDADNDNPTWKPLENGLLKRLLPDFMSMGIEDAAGETVYLYKNRNTREYLNVDAAGRFYVFTGKGYKPLEEKETGSSLAGILHRALAMY